MTQNPAVSSIKNGQNRRFSERLSNAFDGSALSDALAVAAELAHGVVSSSDEHTIRLEAPHSLTQRTRALMNRLPTLEHREQIASLFDLYTSTATNLRSRGYMARQFSSVVPVSAVFDAVSALSPQPATYYEAGQLANVVDKIMAEEFAPLIGWAAGSFDMVTTSGASLANLTALLTARNRRVPGSWVTGTTREGVRRPAIAVGEDAHYSVGRVAGIIGIGAAQIVRLPLDEERRISIPGANHALERALESGLEVFCIVASAGTTALGTIDPLDELALLARRHDAWLHVDAAHNGAFLVSDRLRPRLKGIEKADSFCIDAHKTLFVPGLTTLLFYREKGAASEAFPTRASYVQDPVETEMSLFESGSRNFECTKRPSIVNLWIAWSLYGRELFEEKLDYLIDLTEEAAVLIASQPDFEVVHVPEANILGFVYQPQGENAVDMNRLQIGIRDLLRDEGRFFISKVDLGTQTVLRVVFMNHLIDASDVAALVRRIRAAGHEVLAEIREPVAAASRPKAHRIDGTFAESLS